MNTRFSLPVAVILALLAGGVFYLQSSSPAKTNVSVQRLREKGLFVGDSSKNLLSKKSYDHQATLRTIDDAWDDIMLGNEYGKSGNYEDAAKAYQKAYTLDRGSRAVSGLKLAMTYEKLNRYDEGITLLDQMIQNGELSANGVKNANEIKARLLAAKQNQSQTSSP